MTEAPSSQDDGACASPSTSPTSRRTPAPCCAWPPALASPVDIIEPAGFDVSDRNLRRAGLDYLDRVDDHAPRLLARLRGVARARPAAASSSRPRRARRPIRTSPFGASDSSCVGRESAGVPDEVHAAADARVVVPMRPGLRSLNVAVAAAMILGEALRQTGAFPRRAFPRHAAACHRDRRRTSPMPETDARRRACRTTRRLVRGAARPDLRRLRGARGRGRGPLRPARRRRRAASSASPGSAPTTAARPAAAASWR